MATGGLLVVGLTVASQSCLPSPPGFSLPSPRFFLVCVSGAFLWPAACLPSGWDLWARDSCSGSFPRPVWPWAGGGLGAKA